jgi:hypothetical protein
VSIRAMAASDPYAHLERLSGCLASLNSSLLFKGCAVPIFGLIALALYINYFGPP